MTRPILYSLFLSLASLVLGQPSHAKAEIRYDLIDLGNLGGAVAQANAINDRGEVVGRADTLEGERHAFIWDATNGMFDISAQEGYEAEAVDINNRGEVVGTGLGDNRYAFFWSRENRINYLHPTGFVLSWANSINDKGVIVGGAMKNSGKEQVHRTFLWENADTPGVVIAEPEEFFVPEAMNERGDISGWFRRGRIREGKSYEAMLRFSTGELLELEVPQDCWSCGGTRIDDSGTLTGLCRDGGSDPVATVRWVGSKIVDRMDFKVTYPSVEMAAVDATGRILVNVREMTIDPISKMIDSSLAPFTERRMADDLSRQKTWAEKARDSLSKAGVYKGYVPRSFPLLWDGEDFIDLNELIPEGSGWELQEANDINKHGQIVGKGLCNGNPKAFLLMPIVSNTGTNK
ncbi:MAG: hypothetical protein KC940_10675 [Candidatus Omnitrophica bacterium]|nr:hypothetical protein [Candidatus Omnitrophota bacterium]